MLGTKIYKIDLTVADDTPEEKERVDAVQAQYAELSVWCNENTRSSKTKANIMKLWHYQKSHSTNSRRRR